MEEREWLAEGVTELHAGGQAALHDREIAGGEVPVEVRDVCRKVSARVRAIPRVAP